MKRKTYMDKEISIKLSSVMLTAAERLAKRDQITRSEWIRRAITVSIKRKY
jgi:metal-responsive CopG/Arc/MetJ family transcriptional regulator